MSPVLSAESAFLLEETQQVRVLRMWRAMEKQRWSWLSTWRDIVNYVVPWRGRFVSQATDGVVRSAEGKPVGENIIDGVASRSLRTLASGMMSSLTSPARPWFRLTTADPMLAEVGSVRGYLNTIERIIQWVFAKSNLHNELHVCYRDLGSIGTAPFHIDEDDQDVIRAYVYPPGQYALACNARQRVDSVGRQFSYTIRQLLQRFGIERMCRSSQRLARQGHLNQSVPVVHLIAPNEDFMFGVPGLRGFRWWSFWLELNAAPDEPLLGVKGYRQFPTAAARWEVTGTEDIYGHSPCREALPDIKQLQHMDEKKVELVDKALTPPVQSPPGTDYPSMLAGANTFLPSNLPAGAKIEPIWEPDYNAIQQARYSVAELEQRIRQSLFEDLWRLLVDRGPDQEIGPGNRPTSMTATEVAAQHEEKLTLLGPVVERVHNELLSPLIRRTIGILAEKRMLPPPPRDLAQALASGSDVRIEYLSVLALAQRLLGLGSLERFASIAMALMRIDPKVADKVDADEALDQAMDMLGIPPSVGRSDEQVAEIRVARARQQTALAAQAQAAQAAATAKSLGQTPVTEDTALARLMSEYGPVAESAVQPAPGMPQ